MTINPIFAVALAALMFSSCAKQDENPNKDLDQNKGNLTMCVSSVPMKSRAMDDSQVDGTTIRSFVVRNLDAGGVQQGAEVTITSDRLANIMKSIADLPLTDPKRIIEQLDSRSTQIEARGYNNPIAPAWRPKSELDVASITTLQLNNVSFADIPFISITANGRDIITKTDNVGTGIHEGHKIWTVQLEVKPYFARLEISGTPKEKNNAATFVVNSIYVNNIALTKDAERTKYEGNGGIWQTNSDGKITGTTGDMDAQYKTTLLNMYNESLTNYDSKVDAYTLWGQAGMLHIVLKVKVTPLNGDPSYFGFVTLQNISGAASIEIGKIYKLDLADLTLEYEKNVDPQPYDKGADLFVGLTVHPWTEVTLTPGL